MDKFGVQKSCHNFPDRFEKSRPICPRQICRREISLAPIPPPPYSGRWLGSGGRSQNKKITRKTPKVEADPEREGALDGVKAAVCANVNLFMEVAEEEFEKYLTTFANDVWQLLVKVSPAPGQDGLAMAALRFLTTLSRSVHAKLFGDAATLKQICESIVIPNLRASGGDAAGRGRGGGAGDGMRADARPQAPSLRPHAAVRATDPASRVHGSRSCPCHTLACPARRSVRRTRRSSK